MFLLSVERYPIIKRLKILSSKIAESFDFRYDMILDKMQVERESKSVGLEKEDAMNRARRVGVGEIAVRVG